MATIEDVARALLESVQGAWDDDLTWSGWLGSEGERVRDNALALVQAASAGTLRDLLHATTVHAHLGQGWLEAHATCWDKADALQALLDQPVR